MIDRWNALFPAVALLLCATTAHAGPVEQLVQLAEHPTDADVATLRYDFAGDGLFFTRDGGTTWELLCASAISPTINNAGRIAVAGDGTTLMGIFGGILSDDGKGCSWTEAPELSEKWITDIVSDPLDPTITYAVSSNGDPGVMNGIYVRDAGTGAWTEMGSREELLIGRLHAVATGADTVRFYESIVRGQDAMGAPNYLLRYSDDDGTTWTEFAVASPNGALRLEAIDPSDTDRLVVSVSREGADDSVLISTDAGETLTEALTLVKFGGVAFAPDGRVWIGDSGEVTSTEDEYGLWSAADVESSFEKVVDAPINCVTYDAALDGPKACGQRTFGPVDLVTGTLVEDFDMQRATTMTSCENQDVRADCADQFGADNSDGFCGETHFPCAPVCAPYEVPLSEPDRCCDVDGGVCLVGAGGTGGAPTPSDAGVPMAGTTAGVSGTPTAGTGGTTPPTGGTTGAAATGGDDDGGCSCRAPGGSRGDSSRGLLAALGVLLVLAYRRHR